MSFGKRPRASTFCSHGGLRLLRWLLPLVALAVFAERLSGQAQGGSASDSGAFQILVAKRRIGTERFRITSGASGWETTAELQLNPGQETAVSESSTLRLDSNWRPRLYERQQKSPQTGSLSAQFGASETTLVSVTPEGTNEQVFYLPETFLVVLDTNFFHHYSFLLRQYDSSRGGAQPFNVFIPQEALPGIIHLELLGKETVAVGSAARELDHYKGVTDETQIEIWATPEKAVQRVWIPSAELEVLRQ